MPQQPYDVLVIGAGIVGGAVLYELAKYQLRIAVIDKENDAAEGTTKANSAIVHAGYDPKPGSKMAFHNVRGCAMMKELCERLDVHYNDCGSLVIATDSEEEALLQTLFERGVQNGVPGLKLLSHAEALAMEPNLNPAVIGALYAPSAGIVSPWELCIALVENAVQNGADFFLEQEVTSIEPSGTGWRIATAQGLTLETRTLVNAAGVYADRIHDMVAPHDFSIGAAKGEYYLLDKNQGGLVSRVIFQCPSQAGKGVLVAPTVHGNLIVGPDRTDGCEKDDLSTTQAGLDFVKETIQKSCTKVDFRQSIRNFAGLRAIANYDDFIIREVPGCKGFIELAGIQSPGLTSAPSIALEAVELLKQAGLELRQKERHINSRTVTRMKELSPEEQQQKIKENPLYGRVICRCETITEGEIVDALRSPIAPPTIDAVKRRAGAGMGRCQGGFCSPRVLEIIARERGIAPPEVLQDRPGSYLLLPKQQKEES